MPIPFASDKDWALKSVDRDALLRPGQRWVGVAGVLALALVAVLGIRQQAWSMRPRTAPHRSTRYTGTPTPGGRREVE